MGKSVSITEKIVEENEESEIIKSILLGSEHLKPLIHSLGHTNDVILTLYDWLK